MTAPVDPRDSSAAFYALVPAAGSGARMGGEKPKQYLPLAGRPLIWHGLRALCGVARISRVFVVLSPHDADWVAHDWSTFGTKLMPLFCGGATRADSVLNGLRATADQVRAEDWMLVHDAARPCLTSAQVDSLIDTVCRDSPGDGGILALPVADTLKRADEHAAIATIAATVPRSGLWQAQTPQMFRHGDLLRALASGKDAQAIEAITDEASAMEMLGFRPCLVKSDPGNLKVTYPSDQRLAEWILQQRGEMT
ncbi:4-diphosphocytidyl-2C-methyl-D-erythritol synthase [Sterolibacterium denitrificans]|uniref:2-C-methyl-D-erythritol 4-phosphate cytidylyltransferase n=1 Tax=Sterolibacterium denitrificans TaxID=157592 RepID=A0A7Z7MV31_9PROT|nr:4-diphosphocytidyl-2C-methyl-D-erythritol synthase [Sterolibacterium denitrificans]